MINVALLFLSHGRHRIIERTLSSYKKFGLLDVVSEKKAFFQAISDKDREIAEKYSLDIIGSETNIGISGGFMSLAMSSRSKYVLLLENDWELLKSPLKTLQQACEFIQKRQVSVVRLRHRKNPGEPLHSRNFKCGEIASENAKRHLMNCIHWVENPAEQFPQYIHNEFPEWYTTTSKYANFTNNPCLYDREWFIRNVLPFCRKEGRHVEPEIDGWWANQNFKIAQGEGLFKHNDK